MDYVKETLSPNIWNKLFKDDNNYVSSCLYVIVGSSAVPG